MNEVASTALVFPETERVIYRRNPLVEVICQLRFPQILRIGAESPVQFQEKIRRHYPVFEEKTPLGEDIPVDMLKLLGSQSPLKLGRTTYHFKSEDDAWTIALTREFLAVSTPKYERWGAFLKQVEIALEALVEVYQPAFFTRIGLRYKDLICRSSLDLDTLAWSELLQPHITAELAVENLLTRVKTKKTEFVVDLENGDKVRIVHGLFSQADSDELCYLVDSDFFTTQKVGTQHAGDKLGAFNKQAGALFRWCIAEKLHEAMEPMAP